MACSVAQAGGLDFLQQHILPRLLQYQFDAVRNVRLRAAVTLNVIVQQGEPWCSLDGVVGALALLAKDADPLVAAAARNPTDDPYR